MLPLSILGVTVQAPIRSRRLARGIAALEFTLVALPLLLAGLTVLELSRWQLARTLLSHALLEAARGGQTGAPDPQSMAERFELAVLPLWPSPQGAHNRQAALAQLRHTAHSFQQSYGFPLWHIQPHQASAGLSPAPGLVLELTWWHRPWVPGMQAFLRQLGRLSADTALRQGMARTGWLPIRQRLAIEWHVQPEQPGMGPGASLATITPGTALPLPNPAPPWQLREPGVGSGYHLLCRGLACHDAQPFSPAPSPQPISPEDNSDLCGTVLCCAKDLAT